MKGQFPAVLPLASLNGQNGFKIDGENNGDRSGYAVGSAGDFNGDGHDDLIIGAYYYPGSVAKGRSYVVFGGPGVGSSGDILLGNLNGANGFKLDGENNGDQSGWSVSAVGDINGDGNNDLLIGVQGYPNATFKGCSYVMFGGPEVGSSGDILLSSLNGANGFKLNGEENNGDASGFSVNMAGDINSDGHADLIIGAPYYPGWNSQGRSYVVFGGLGVGNSSGVFNLSSLNGVNGFKLNGENNNDASGWSVSAAGDINSDGHADLIIGAYGYPGGSNKGRSYVVFGGPGVGNSGIFNLSSLTGVNGFKLDGENSGDDSGWSVGTIGDINGDEHADLVIGAYGYPGHNNKGRSYVIFGGTEVGNGGIFNLSSLMGVNGFKLDGENNQDQSSQSVSLAGDINGDGYADLIIGAWAYPGNNVNSAKGRSYVVFGGPRVGGGGLFNLSSLNGINGFKFDGENFGDNSGISVSTAGDVNGDGVPDLLIGAHGHNNSTGRSYVIFGDAPPVLVNNSLSLSPGATITLNATYLTATDRNHNNNTLVFIPSGVLHGQFELISNPGVSLVNFTQQQVTSGAIQFVHDGTLVPPNYNITVRSTGIAWVGPMPAQINFIGAPQSYFPTIFSLANLDGNNGFKIDGEQAGDNSGVAVSNAGDVNGDGYGDIIIGANTAQNNNGRSYVIFGSQGVGNSSLISLSNLTGKNGFKVDNYYGGQSGGAVSTLKDINADGYDDFIIGAWSASLGGQFQSGCSFVIFGNPKIGSTGSINLTALNGSSGFVIEGESPVDSSGSSVSSAGDLNADGYFDILIGAPWGQVPYWGATPLQVGHSYVVYGGLGVGRNGTLTLSSLNGTNGFRLNGEINGDQSGSAVSGGGDINGDGIDDILIGAWMDVAGNRTQPARSYVVFGGAGIGSNGQFNLSSLNGLNGFKIDGELTSDYVSGGYIGPWVNLAGDVNQDGYVDFLMGAQKYNNFMGRVYVLFGNSDIGNKSYLNLTSLDGINGFKFIGDLSSWAGEDVSGVGDINGDGYDDFGTEGYIIFGGKELNNNTLLFNDLNGVSGFQIISESSKTSSDLQLNTAGDMNGDGVADLLLGDSLYGPLNGTHTGRSYIIFGDIPPTLVQNRLSLALGQTINLNQTHLSAYDRNHPNNTIVFIPRNVTHGRFQLSTQPGISLANFTLPQLQSGVVQFVHDGSITAPSYNITVQSAGIAWTGPHPANISFTVPFSIVNNQLTLNNDQTVVLSLSNLQAIDPGVNNNSQITFTVGNVQNGYFATVPSGSGASKNITSFTQAQIQNGAVEFVHNGDKQAPSYSVLASDGVQSTLPSVAKIDFIGAPNITQNSVNITTNGPIILTPAMLNVTAPSGVTPNQISLTVTNLQHATITSTLTQAPVSNFTLAEVEAGDIQLTPDGNLITPSYTITATVIPTALSSAPNAAAVLFSNQGVYAPQLVNNYLEITQGKATTLSNRYLSAQEPPNGQALNNTTMFFVSNIEYGHFSLNNQPQTWITAFSQQQLLESQVQFVQDGSASTPVYQTAVQAFDLQSASLEASIFFTPVNVPSPVSSPGDSDYTTIQKAIIGACISGGMGIGFALVQICLKRIANRKLLQALGEGANDYDQNVVRPVAQEIAAQVKITGFLNATTNIRMRRFKSAVRSLLGALSAKGVDLDFKKMRAPERDALINEIGNQTYRWVKSQRRGCTACCPGFSSFFKPQILPENL